MINLLTQKNKDTWTTPEKLFSCVPFLLWIDFSHWPTSSNWAKCWLYTFIYLSGKIFLKLEKQPVYLKSETQNTSSYWKKNRKNAKHKNQLGKLYFVCWKEITNIWPFNAWWCRKVTQTSTNLQLKAAS